MNRFKSTLCAMAAGVILSITGAQAVEACTTFYTFRTTRLELYFCTLRGWDSNYCYYSCQQLPAATLDY